MSSQRDTAIGTCNPASESTCSADGDIRNHFGAFRSAVHDFDDECNNWDAPNGYQAGPYQVTHNVSGAGNTAWFNPASFSAPATCTVYSATNPVPCTVGNTQRNQFRGPGYFSDNLSLFKNFPIFRESTLEARIDAFNLTNTPALGQSTATLGSTLGRITSPLGSDVGNVNGVGGPRVLQAGVKISF